MSQTIAFIIDPLDTLAWYHDSSMYLAEVALSMGHEVYLCDYRYACNLTDDKQSISLEAMGQRLLRFKLSCEQVFSNKDLGVVDVVDVDPLQSLDLSQCDVVMMRKDPPVDAIYQRLLDGLILLKQQGVRVVNDPAGIAQTDEKLAILDYPDWIAPTCVSASMSVLMDFLKEYQRIAVKQLGLFGGQGVQCLDLSLQSEQVCRQRLEAALEGQAQLMAQQCLNIHKHGDKRVLIIQGKPIRYACERYPQEGAFLANFAAGGYGKIAPINHRDRALCDALEPMLRERQLDLVGIDIIDGCLTEINVTCPTCIREINAKSVVDVSRLFL